MKINEALKALRIDLDLTQKQMINGTDITVTHYSKMEKGQNRIFIDDIFKILKCRNVSISYFFTRYFNQNNRFNYSEKLNLAFYNKNLDEAKKIKEEIFHDNSTTHELRDRAILILDALKQNYNYAITEEVMNDFFRYEDWTQNDDAIIILGNSIRIDNLTSMKPLLLKLVKKYPNLNTHTIEKQRRLATVGINYLYTLRKAQKQLDNPTTKILDWLKTMSNFPELGILKELYAYFMAVYTDQTNISQNIKQVLKISGYKNISENLPN